MATADLKEAIFSSLMSLLPGLTRSGANMIDILWHGLVVSLPARAMELDS